MKMNGDLKDAGKLRAVGDELRGLSVGRGPYAVI